MSRDMSDWSRGEWIAVYERLDEDGHLSAEGKAELDRLKPKKKCAICGKEKECFDYFGKKCCNECINAEEERGDN